MIQRFCGWMLLAWIPLLNCRNDGREENNGSEGEAEAESEAEAEGENPADDAAIYAIQRGEVAVGTEVTIENVVVTAVDTLDSGNGIDNVVVQEAAEDEQDGRRYSAILVYQPTRVDEQNGSIEDLMPGDVVTVHGIVDEFALKSDTSGQTMTEISEGTIERVGSTEPIEPVAVDLADLMSQATAEPWESVLISVSNLQALCGPNEYDVVEMDGAAGNVEVAYDLYAPDPSPAFGDCYASVTGTLNYFFSYRIQPRNADDVVLGGSCDELGMTPIADVQAGLIDEKADVYIRATVTASSLADDGGFFVQQGTGPQSGLYVFADGSALTAGDEVVILGNAAEYFDETQIDARSTCVVGTADLPAAQNLTAAEAASEEWEGVLVQVADATVTGANKYGDFEVDTTLLVDDELYDFGEQPSVGTVFSSITGPIRFTYDEFRILPRDAADLVAR